SPWVTVRTASRTSGVHSQQSARRLCFHLPISFQEENVEQATCKRRSSFDGKLSSCGSCVRLVARQWYVRKPSASLITGSSVPPIVAYLSGRLAGRRTRISSSTTG